MNNTQQKPEKGKLYKTNLGRLSYPHVTTRNKQDRTGGEYHLTGDFFVTGILIPKSEWDFPNSDLYKDMARLFPFFYKGKKVETFLDWDKSPVKDTDLMDEKRITRDEERGCWLLKAQNKKGSYDKQDPMSLTPEAKAKIEAERRTLPNIPIYNKMSRKDKKGNLVPLTFQEACELGITGGDYAKLYVTPYGYSKGLGGVNLFLNGLYHFKNDSFSGNIAVEEDPDAHSFESEETLDEGVDAVSV